MIFSESFLQGWSCCQRRVTDFTEFLNMNVSFVLFHEYFGGITLRTSVFDSHKECLQDGLCSVNRYES